MTAGTISTMFSRLKEKCSVPLHYLWMLPLISGLSWLIMLFTLLFFWIGRGCPKYPKQSNPYVAMISDIGAFELKPLFITFSTLTGLTFIATISSVHYARYSPRMYYIQDSTTSSIRTLSILSIISSVVAGVSLVFLSIFDTFRWHNYHNQFLMGCFGGLAGCMVLTTVVYLDQTRKPSRFTRLRFYCTVNMVIVWIEVVLGVIFVITINTSHYRTAGFLEWTITILGGFYILAFVGFVAVPDDGVDVHERDPLLGDQAYINEVEA
ncbi:hypothetical protein K402DRAFT_241637 [Aulographum hederae CBS 113979]|uniref:CWH43-like N-terminal domain-containing protein n=1 Tax=Aulographum hederae CBS 113979 TaxID=1176131 RepID=A0A6G1GJS5_9PEZI|nr:hypothetical protein K402DRAFT_241637 [Aulographum hederae CBS 113979]